MDTIWKEWLSVSSIRLSFTLSITCVEITSHFRDNFQDILIHSLSVILVEVQ